MEKENKIIMCDFTGPRLEELDYREIMKCDFKVIDLKKIIEKEK